MQKYFNIIKNCTIVDWLNIKNLKAETMTRKRKIEFRQKIMKNNLMQRFIREIEREELLDAQTLNTLLVFHPVRNK
jgi:ribosomal protein L10